MSQIIIERVVSAATLKSAIIFHIENRRYSLTPTAAMDHANRLMTLAMEAQAEDLIILFLKEECKVAVEDIPTILFKFREYKETMRRQ